MITSPAERIERLRNAGWWDDTTLHGLLWKNSAAHPDRLAVADQPNREELSGQAPYRLDYAQLRNAAVNLACDFMDQGIAADDALVVQLPNITELAVVYYAASAIGAIVSPVPVQYGRHELQKAAKVLSPAAVVTMEQFRGAPLAANARTAMAESVRVLSFGSGDAGGIGSLRLDSGNRPANDEKLSEYEARHPADADAVLTICCAGLREPRVRQRVFRGPTTCGSPSPVIRRRPADTAMATVF
jgi:non-ribosomal peptide synthetase component E (peptide arylation enzyme)